MAGGLLRLLRSPAAMVEANWAGLLGILAVVTAVPALGAVVRLTSDVDRYADDGLPAAFRWIRATWRRDLTVTLLGWLYVVLAASTAWLMVVVYSGGPRVFFVSLLTPVYWVLGGLLLAYIFAVGRLDPETSAGQVRRHALALAFRHPARVLLLPAAVLLTTPVIVLAPLTLAGGVSLPAWLGQRLLTSVWPPDAEPLAAGED